VRVGGDRGTTVEGADRLRVRGDAAAEVDGGLTLDVAHDLDEHAAGDRRARTGGAHTTTARRVVVEAQDEIVLRAGAASITLRRDGSILIAGGDLTLKAGGTLKARALKEVAIRGAKLVGN
jgi:type VI secretion system secreted protein VgrG